MKMASIIGFLFGTHNIANSFVTIEARSLWSCADQFAHSYRLQRTLYWRIVSPFFNFSQGVPHMASKTPAKKHAPRIAPVTPEEAKRLVDLVDEAIYEFEGQVDNLETAIGMLFVGRQFGWRPLLLIHNKRTIRKYEEILGIDIRKYFPEETPRSERSLAYKGAKLIGKFWKAVSGEVPLENRRDLAR